MANTSNTVEMVLKARDEASGAITHVSESLETMRGHMLRIKDIAIGNILGNLGVGGIDSATRSLVDFGKSLIESNAEVESLRNRLNILYQSTTEGAAAFAFLKQNELIKPFDIQSIMDASTRLVAFKQDITTLLPAIEDIAGSMGVSLQRVAIGFDAALAGRFAILRNIGISKQALAQAGAQFDKGGHLTDPSSLARAFIELSQTQFKGGADKMGQTWNGLMSSMSSQWFYFKSNLGAGAFAVLEKQLHGIVHMLQDPANAAAIQNIETTIGAGLAQMTVNAINFGRAIGPYVGSAIAFIARAWPLVERGAGAAFAFVSTVVAGFANWLANTGFPAIERVINAIANAWIVVQPIVGRVLTNISNDLSGFVSAFAGIAAGLMQGVAGAFTIGMGLVQSIFGGALTLLSGNWAGFQNDINGGANLMVKGIVEMVGGMSIALLPLADALMGPWTALAHGIRSVFSTIAPFVGAIMGAIAVVVTSPITTLVGMINTTIVAINHAIRLATGSIDALIDKYNGLVGKIPGMGGHTIHKIGGSTDIGTIPFSPVDVFSGVNSAVQQAMKGVGIGPNQQITAGRTQAQAAADINARTNAILAELGLGGGTAVGKTFSAKGGVGADILNQIKGLFADLGGKFTMADLLKAFGLKFQAGGVVGYTPPAGGLPVAGYPTGDAAAASGGGLAGQRSVTGRVPLGAVGATFGQSLATLAALHAGTDPATRAAQKQVDQAQAAAAQRQKQIDLQTQEVSGTHTLVSRIETLIAAVAAGHLPQATPPNHLRSVGVLRPKVS